MKHAIYSALFVSAVYLTGCAGAPTESIIVMRPCMADVPERPIMPTENLAADATLDDFVRAAIAEIERREGYELVLRAAFVFCKSGD